MKFIFAPDSFKGSLSSVEEIAILKCVAEELCPGCELKGLPMADGGEGTAAAILAAAPGQMLHPVVRDPLFRPVTAYYGLLASGTAVIEMSAASGLPLVEEALRDPERTSSFGTGELIREALDRGARELLLCVGGSATNDGGIGTLAALGARFLDGEGRELPPVGGSLGLIDRIELKELDPRLAECRIRVLCDVTNPLLGDEGATYTFGPQKGAGLEALARLEAGMTRYAERSAALLGKDLRDMPGAGAAGGLAFALAAYCGGTLISGIEAVLSVLSFDEKVRGADLIITGEGCLDRQSLKGKVISGILRHGKALGIPVAAVVGMNRLTAEETRALGFAGVYPLVSGDVTAEQSLADPVRFYEARARELFRELGNRRKF